jgi:hypothetical protein
VLRDARSRGQRTAADVAEVADLLEHVIAEANLQRRSRSSTCSSTSCASTAAPRSCRPTGSSHRRFAQCPKKWARLGSNQRPLACEASALPLSYAPEGCNLPENDREPGLPRPRMVRGWSEVTLRRPCRGRNGSAEDLLLLRRDAAVHDSRDMAFSCGHTARPRSFGHNRLQRFYAAVVAARMELGDEAPSRRDRTLSRLFRHRLAASLGLVEVSSASIVGVHPHASSKNPTPAVAPRRAASVPARRLCPSTPARRRTDRSRRQVRFRAARNAQSRQSRRQSPRRGEVVRAKAGRAPLDRVWPLRRLAGALRSRPARCEFGRSRCLRRLPAKARERAHSRLVCLISDRIDPPSERQSLVRFAEYERAPHRAEPSASSRRCGVAVYVQAWAAG